MSISKTQKIFSKNCQILANLAPFRHNFTTQLTLINTKFYIEETKWQRNSCRILGKADNFKQIVVQELKHSNIAGFKKILTSLTPILAFAEVSINEQLLNCLARLRPWSLPKKD